MKHIVLLITLALFSLFNVLKAQSPPLDFVDATIFGDGEGGTDEAYNVVSDEEGNFYVGGFYQGAEDFDPGEGFEIVHSNQKAYYVAKYSPANELLWLNTIPSGSVPQNLELTLDEAGDLLICTSYADVIYPDPDSDMVYFNSVSETEGDIFMGKYSPDGEYIWGKSMGSPGVEGASGIITNSQNEIYLTGSFADTCDFDPSENVFHLFDTGGTGNSSDPYLAKYTPDGDFIWAFGIEGARGSGFDIELTAEEDVLLTGRFTNTVDFDPSEDEALLTSNGNHDGFVARYSPEGDYQWAINIGGALDDEINGLAVGADDSFYITGAHRYVTDFDPSATDYELTAVGVSDIFLAKYDPTGNFDWAFSLGTSSLDVSYDVGIDPDQNLYITGLFDGTIDFDPSQNTAERISNGFDYFVASYDNSGAYRWAQVPTSDGSDRSNALEVTTTGKVISCGKFVNEIDLDPGPGEDIFNNFPIWTTTFVAAYSLENGDYDSGFVVQDREGGNDEGRSIVCDEEGNYYVSGNFYGGVDFDPDTGVTYLEPGIYQNAWVGKYDNDQNLIWAKAFFGNSSTSESIDIDQDGNVIVTGYFGGTVDFDPNEGEHFVSAEGSISSFVVKLTSDGELDWVKTFGGSHYNYIRNHKVDNDNNIVVMGSFRYTMDLNPGPGVEEFASAHTDVFIVKLDENGDYLWSKVLSGGSHDYGFALDCDSEGNIFVGGQMRNELEFNPTGESFLLDTDGFMNGFVASYTADGEFNWAEMYGGSGIVEVFSLAAGSDGEVYATGTFRNTIDLNPSGTAMEVTANGDEDVFLFKVNSTGETEWAKSFGNDQYLNAGHEVIIEGELLYLAGFFYYDMMFDEAIPESEVVANSSADGYVAVFDTAGAYQNSASFGSIYADYAWGLDVSGEDVFITGFVGGDADFLPGPEQNSYSAFGDRDIFVLKLGSIVPCEPTFENLTMHTCAPYISPSGLEFSDSGVYADSTHIEDDCYAVYEIDLTILPSSSDTLEVHGCYDYFDEGSGMTFTEEGFHTTSFTNEFGCDSLIVFEVFLDTTSSFHQETSCDSFTWNETTYDESGTYEDIFTNSAGCDSIVTLDLTILQSTTGFEEETACDSFTWETNGTTYEETGIYMAILENAVGCDSTVTLDLTINQSTEGSEGITACDSFTWEANGTTYEESGSYFIVLTNAAGCDSTATLELTINQSTSGSEEITTCDSYTWEANGTTYEESGSFSTVLTNAAGCDSTATLDLTINQSTSGSEEITACDSFTWEANGTTYEESGSFSTVLTNAAGCDSTATLELTINQSTSSSEEITNCDNYTWEANGTTYDESGEYTTTLQTAAGCDSVLTIVLSIETVDISVSVDSTSITALEENAVYQWLDCDDDFEPIEVANDQTFTASETGNYAVLITQGECSATSECQFIDVVNITEIDNENVIRAFPNPTSGKLTIESEKYLSNVKIEIRDVAGRLIKRTAFENRQICELEIQGESGVYTVHLHDENGEMKVFRVVKE